MLCPSNHQNQFPWTKDHILQRYKFTNAYRAADRVSQYLIKNIIYNTDNHQSADEIFFRIILFKLFNKIETWELFIQKIGVPCYGDYSFKAYDRLLTSAMNKGKRIFSAAYIMPSGYTTFGYKKKHRSCLKVLEKMMSEGVHYKIMEAKKMQNAFDILRSYPMIGDFLAYQLITDINYSTLTNFSENEFVVPGPGSLNGIRKCFDDLGDLTCEEIIRFIHDKQEEEFERLSINFQNLWGRKLQLIDCQNIFCEIDKYSRIAHPEIQLKNGRKRIKQIFKQNINNIDYWFPPKWEINDKINKQ